MPRSLRAWVFAIAALSLLLGLFAGRIAQSTASPETRAEWLGRAGKWADAERVWWDELQKGHVTVPIVIAFLEAHERASAIALFGVKGEPSAEPTPMPGTTATMPKAEPALPDAMVDAFVRSPSLPPDVSLIARFVRFGPGGEDGKLRDQLFEAAAKSPPMPWANHVLADEALESGRPRDAADHYEREGVAYQRAKDIATALHIYAELGDWATVDAKLRDPRIAPYAPPSLHVQRGMAARDIRHVLRYLLPFSFPPPSRGPLVLAVIAGLCWFAFCARFGQMALRPAFRVPIYFVAFGLGVLSIAPTMFLIVWQETVLHLVPNGTMVRDAIFYVLGVGFREELSKLLCFLPLVPVLRRWGTPLDVLACGALVGLGFAAAENLQYFSQGDLASALGRFLTANFLHMSMTGLATLAFFRIPKSDEGFYDFTVTFLTVVALHGAYDFFLASPVMHGELSFLSMAVFVILARNFVIEMHAARLKAGRSQPLLPVFAIGMTCVTGASFVWAAALVGPAGAAHSMFLGLLGVAILVIVFVRQLQHV